MIPKVPLITAVPVDVDQLDEDLAELEFYLDADELHQESMRSWEDNAADDAGVPRFGEI